MKYDYCPKCGSKLIQKQAGDDGKVPYCESCEKYWFDSFSTCVIVLVYNEFNEIALLKQLYLSDKYNVFVAGYMQVGESAEKAATREVKEELGIDVEKIEYADSVWFEKGQNLMLGFLAFAKKQEFKLSKEVDSASWVKYSEVPNTLFPDSPENAAWTIYRKYLEKLIINS